MLLISDLHQAASEQTAWPPDQLCLPAGATEGAGKGKLGRPASRKKLRPQATTGHADRGRRLSK